MLFRSTWNLTVDLYKSCLHEIRWGVRGGPLDPPRTVRQYAELFRDVPPGEPILTRLAKPYLLDFRKHRIYLADWPGGASPPPGMPSFQGPERLAEYLTRLSIRYVAYSYRSHAYFDDLFKITLTSYFPWIRTQCSHAYDFQDSLEKLGSTRARVYDDGEHFVLEIGRAHV